MTEQFEVTPFTADWRTASLPAHRTWTALGFSATEFRLHRHIDERIAWAGAMPG